MVLHGRQEGRWNAHRAVARAGLISIALCLVGHAHGQTNSQAGARNSYDQAVNAIVEQSAGQRAVGTYKPTCEAAETREDAEFCEERKAADAETKSAHLAVVQAWIAAIGIGFVVVTLWFTKRAADAAAKAARVAERALVDVESAYVYMHVMKVEMIRHGGLVTGWNISPVIRNSGATRARWMLTHVNFQIVDGSDLPDDFGFPDQWTEGTPEKDKVLPRPSSLGPTSTIECGPVFIHIVDVGHILDGTRSAFVYGWVEYNDMFSEKRHRTEYCFEVLANGTVRNVEEVTPTLRTYRLFNGAEEECFKSPTTEAPPRLRVH